MASVDMTQEIWPGAVQPGLYSGTLSHVPSPEGLETPNAFDGKGGFGRMEKSINFLT